MRNDPCGTPSQLISTVISKNRFQSMKLLFKTLAALTLTAFTTADSNRYCQP